MSKGKKVKNYQALFKNKILTPEEIEWCRLFEDSTTFEPNGCDSVIDEKTFIDFCRHNIQWFEDHANEAVHHSEKRMGELPYYRKLMWETTLTPEEQFAKVLEPARKILRDFNESVEKLIKDQ